MYEFPPKKSLAGLMKGAEDIIQCAFERGVKNGRYLEKQDSLKRKDNSEWISVEERLPERNGQMCVGLYTQHGAHKSQSFPYIFTWHAYGDNGYVNGPHFSDEGLDGLKVHYWMPLPEPPKEE